MNFYKKINIIKNVIKIKYHKNLVTTSNYIKLIF